MTFHYQPSPAQAAYIDDVTSAVVKLPFWVTDSNDLSRLARAIRSRAFGNISHVYFKLVVRGHHLAATPDEEFLISIFNGTGAASSNTYTTQCSNWLGM